MNKIETLAQAMKKAAPSAAIIQGGITALLKSIPAKSPDTWKNAVSATRKELQTLAGDSFRPFAASFKSLASREKSRRWPKERLSRNGSLISAKEHVLRAAQAALKWLSKDEIIALLDAKLQ